MPLSLTLSDRAAELPCRMLLMSEILLLSGARRSVVADAGPVGAFGGLLDGGPWRPLRGPEGAKPGLCIDGALETLVSILWSRLGWMPTAFSGPCSAAGVLGPEPWEGS